MGLITAVSPSLGRMQLRNYEELKKNYSTALNFPPARTVWSKNVSRVACLFHGAWILQNIYTNKYCNDHEVCLELCEFLLALLTFSLKQACIYAYRIQTTKGMFGMQSASNIKAFSFLQQRVTSSVITIKQSPPLNSRHTLHSSLFSDFIEL